MSNAESVVDALGRRRLLYRAVYNIVVHMVKTISKIGNSHGLMFDATLMEMAHLKAGDQVNVEVHEGGAITVTPLRPRPSREDVSRVIDQTMKDYAGTMKKLA